MQKVTRLLNRKKICSMYSEDQRCQIVFHTEAIGGNSEEIARTPGSCYEDLTHGLCKNDANRNTNEYCNPRACAEG